jgi:hypothetical protein
MNTPLPFTFIPISYPLKKHLTLENGNRKIILTDLLKWERVCRN